MKIFAKKVFKLQVDGETFTTKPLVFDTMPDAFAQSLLFQWAVKDGDIEIIGTPEKQKRLENDPGEPTAARAPKPPKQPEQSGDAT